MSDNVYSDAHNSGNAWVRDDIPIPPASPRSIIKCDNCGAVDSTGRPLHRWSLRYGTTTVRCPAPECDPTLRHHVLTPGRMAAGDCQDEAGAGGGVDSDAPSVGAPRDADSPLDVAPARVASPDGRPAGCEWPECFDIYGQCDGPCQVGPDDRRIDALDDMARKLDEVSSHVGGPSQLRVPAPGELRTILQTLLALGEQDRRQRHRRAVVDIIAELDTMVERLDRSLDGYQDAPPIVFDSVDALHGIVSALQASIGVTP